MSRNQPLHSFSRASSQQDAAVIQERAGRFRSIVELDTTGDETDGLSDDDIWGGSLVPRRSVRQHAVPPDARTCNQAVMSGRMAISFVEFLRFSFDFDGVRCASLMPFLVRNWCGCATLRSQDGSRAALVGGLFCEYRKFGLRNRTGVYWFASEHSGLISFLSCASINDSPLGKIKRTLPRSPPGPRHPSVMRTLVALPPHSDKGAA